MTLLKPLKDIHHARASVFIVDIYRIECVSTAFIQKAHVSIHHTDIQHISSHYVQVKAMIKPGPQVHWAEHSVAPGTS